MRGRARLLRGGGAEDVCAVLRAPSCRRTSGLSTANDANVPPRVFVLVRSPLTPSRAWSLSLMAAMGAKFWPPASGGGQQGSSFRSWSSSSLSSCFCLVKNGCHLPPLCGSSFRTPFFCGFHFGAVMSAAPSSALVGRMRRLHAAFLSCLVFPPEFHPLHSAQPHFFPHCQHCSAFQIFLTVPIVIFHVPPFTLCSL